MLCNLDLYIYIYIYYIKKFIYLFFKYPIIPIGGLGSEILNEYTFTQFQNCKKHEKSSLKNKLDMLSWHPASVKPMLEKVRVRALEVVESCHYPCYHHP